MIKKILFVSALLILPNWVVARITQEEIVKKCSFLPTDATIMSDKEINDYTIKENDCLKQEILNLVDLNIRDEKYRAQTKKDFEISIKSARDFFWTSENFNKTCETSSGDYDCGTNGKHLVVDNQLKKILKIYLQFYIDTNNLRATYNID